MNSITSRIRPSSQPMQRASLLSESTRPKLTTNGGIAVEDGGQPRTNSVRYPKADATRATTDELAATDYCGGIRRVGQCRRPPSTWMARQHDGPPSTRRRSLVSRPMLTFGWAVYTCASGARAATTTRTTLSVCAPGAPCTNLHLEGPAATSESRTEVPRSRLSVLAWRDAPRQVPRPRPACLDRQS